MRNESTETFPDSSFGSLGNLTMICCKFLSSRVRIKQNVNAHQTQVSFKDQGCGLKCLPRFLLRNLLRRQFAQLLVDKRQELLGGVLVALLDGRQDSRDLTHDG